MKNIDGKEITFNQGAADTLLDAYQDPIQTCYASQILHNSLICNNCFDGNDRKKAETHCYA